MGFWDGVAKFAQNASRALPLCHVCGERGAQVCRVCSLVGCHRHAYTNIGQASSVCSKCMTEAFPWASEDLRPSGMVTEGWPYNEMPWEILGIPQDASEDDVRKAHREASRMYHPDKETGDAERQVAINRAVDEMLRAA